MGTKRRAEQGCQLRELEAAAGVLRERYEAARAQADGGIAVLSAERELARLETESWQVKHRSFTQHTHVKQAVLAYSMPTYCEISKGSSRHHSSTHVPQESALFACYSRHSREQWRSSAQRACSRVTSMQRHFNMQ